MRKLLLYVLVALACGCGDDEDGFDRKTAFGNSWSEIMEKYHVTDTAGLDVYDIKATNEGQSVLLGLKDGKLWVALHDDTEGALRYEYMTEENYDLERTYHLEYNDYTHIRVGDLRIGYILSSEHGVVFNISLVHYPNPMLDVCFVHEEGITLQTNVEAQFMAPWYDGGVWLFYDPIKIASVSGHTDSYFFNYKGELSFVRLMGVRSEVTDAFIVISPEECIGFCKGKLVKVKEQYSFFVDKDVYTFSRLNMKDGAVIWEVRPLENMEGDFIVESSSITSSNEETVTCSSNIVYKNGDTRSVNFTVDIETGSIVMED